MYIIKDDTNFIPSNNSQNNEFQRNSNKNNKENHKYFNKNDNYSSKSDEKLSDLNTSSGNNDIENSEDNFPDFVKKKINLSFLDSSIDDDISDKEDNDIVLDNNNKPLNNSYYCNQSLNNEAQSYFNCNIDPVMQYINAENNNNKRQLYNIMIMNNIYQNYNYNNYENNQHFLGQNTYNLIRNNNYPQQNNPINQSFSPSVWYNNNNNNNICNQTYNINKHKKSIDKKYIINLLDIKTNKEKRTTIRMMNIPSYFRPLDLAKKIDEKFGISSKKENRVYDFIYIPFKENKKTENIKNAGYAFINFVHPKHILKFYSFFNGKHLKLKTSEKVCIITFASRQGTNLKYKGFEQSINDKYMYFNDTKHHEDLLTD